MGVRRTRCTDRGDGCRVTVREGVIGEGEMLAREFGKFVILAR